MLHGEERAALRGCTVVGGGDGLVAIGRARRHGHIELEQAGRDQAAELDGRGRAADGDLGGSERMPLCVTDPPATGVDVGPNPLA
jgi:hypothetical protein